MSTINYKQNLFKSQCLLEKSNVFFDELCLKIPLTHRFLLAIGGQFSRNPHLIQLYPMHSIYIYIYIPSIFSCLMVNFPL